MDVYFVRHGETLLNKKRVHQSPGTPLSEKGRIEVVKTAEYLRDINPSIIITSEYTRALESARIIALRTGLVPTKSTLFYEIVRPSTLMGRSHFTLETFWYVLLSVLRRDNQSWHYKDAENFTDICARAKEALSYLESISATHRSVVVVSHAVFINIMVSYMCKNGSLGVYDLVRTFLYIERMKNCGVIHVSYSSDVKENGCAWQVVSEPDRT